MVCSQATLFKTSSPLGSCGATMQAADDGLQRCCLCLLSGFACMLVQPPPPPPTQPPPPKSNEVDPFHGPESILVKVCWLVPPFDLHLDERPKGEGDFVDTGSPPLPPLHLPTPPQPQKPSPPASTAHPHDHQMTTQHQPKPTSVIHGRPYSPLHSPRVRLHSRATRGATKPGSPNYNQRNIIPTIKSEWAYEVMSLCTMG